MAALTTTERERVRYHLGYTSVTPQSTLSHGQVIPSDSLLLVEHAMSNLAPSAVGRVRTLIARLDHIDEILFEAAERNAISSAEDVTFNDREEEKLDASYARQAKRLADVLGVPLYWYSSRFREVGGNTVVNGRVR